MTNDRQIPKPPECFLTLCRQMGQDLDLYLARPGNNIFKKALSGQTYENIPELVGYIGQRLNGDFGDEDLQAFWFTTPAEVAFETGAMLRAFLIEVRSIASKPPYWR